MIMHDKLPLFDTVDSINDFKKLFKVLYPKINLGEYTLSVEVNPSYSKDVTFYKFSEYVRYNLEKYSENRCEVVDRYSILFFLNTRPTHRALLCAWLSRRT